MKYQDISATDQLFNNFTNLGNYNASMNFIIGTRALVDGKPLDLNDNQFIRIRAYNLNEKF